MFKSDRFSTYDECCAEKNILDPLKVTSACVLQTFIRRNSQAFGRRYYILKCGS